MARPLKTGKQTVDLAAPAVRVSRIRRDPPPVVKEISIHERNERDRRLAIVGILIFAVALFVAVIGISAGSMPSTYFARIEKL